MDTREAFREIYREVRVQRAFALKEGRNPPSSAFLAVDGCVDWLLYGNDRRERHYSDYELAYKAAIWAVHWRFYPPVQTDVPLGMSERHLGFSMTAEGSTHWYERRLP
jgi:hypothetical protein